MEQQREGVEGGYFLRNVCLAKAKGSLLVRFCVSPRVLVFWSHSFAAAQSVREQVAETFSNSALQVVEALVVQFVVIFVKSRCRRNALLADVNVDAKLNIFPNGPNYLVYLVLFLEIVHHVVIFRPIYESNQTIRRL